MQLGFGLLLREAGVEVRDWTAAYRTPYYNHKSLVEWTGAAHDFAVPFERVLFAPTQWLYQPRVKLCCSAVDCDSVKTGDGEVCSANRVDADPDACCRHQRQKRPLPETVARRRQWSVDPGVRDVQELGALRTHCTLSAGDEQRVQLVERRVERVGAPSNAGRNFTGSSAPSVLRTFFSGVFGGG